MSVSAGNKESFELLMVFCDDEMVSRFIGYRNADEESISRKILYKWAVFCNDGIVLVSILAWQSSFLFFSTPSEHFEED